MTSSFTSLLTRTVVTVITPGETPQDKTTQQKDQQPQLISPGTLWFSVSILVASFEPELVPYSPRWRRPHNSYVEKGSKEELGRLQH